MLLDNTNLYDRYAVEITILERFDGGVPKDPKLIHSWVAAKTGYDDEQTKKLVEQHMPDIDATTEGIAEAMWTGFKIDEKGHYIETRQLKAMLRETAVVLGITKKKRGSRQIVQHGFEVRGFEGKSKVYIEADASTIQNEERPIHVMTPQGPRTAIKRTDFFVEGAKLRFEIWVLATSASETRHLGQADIENMLRLAQNNGIGANRSQQSGKFEVTAFECLGKGATVVSAPEAKPKAKKAG